MKNITEFIVTFGPILTIVGLVCTIIALYLAINQGKSAKQHAIVLENIRDSLSTQYIGSFPGFLPQITTLISQAQSTVSITSSVVTTGVFSDRSAWLKYRNTIENLLHKGCAIEMIVLSDIKREIFQTEQFGLDEEGWKAWLLKPEIKKKLEIFLKNHNSHVDIERLTKKEFFKILDIEHKKAIDNPFLNASIMKVNEHIPLSIWIVDGKQAAFAVPSTSGGYTEHGFITSDARLINAFQEIVQRYHTANGSKNA